MSKYEKYSNKGCRRPRCNFDIHDRYVSYKPGQNPISLPLSQCIIDDQLTFYETVTIFYGSDVEPSIAVNPVCPNEIVVVWQSGRINNSGALELGIAYTFDGGKTWGKSAVPFQICIGGIIQRVSDPWLSYSACGRRVYLSALVFNVIPEPDISNPIQYGVIASISEDNGKTWSEPVYLITTPDTLTSDTGLPFDDKNTITADPNNCKNVYSVWARYPEFQFFINHADVWFAKSNNAGDTWFPATLIYDATKDLCETGLGRCGFCCQCQELDDDPLLDCKCKCKKLTECDCRPAGYDTNWVFNTQIIVLPDGKHDQCNKYNKYDKYDNYDKFNINKCIKFKDPRQSGELLCFLVRTYAIPTASLAQFRNDRFPFIYTANDIVLIRSKDGGNTWSKKATIVSPFTINGTVFTNGYIYSPALPFPDPDNPSIRPINIGNILMGNPSGVRLRTGDNAPGYAVNPRNGNLYVAFQEDGRFRSDSLVQIALTASRDGGHTWSVPVRINRTPQDAPNPQAFTPAVAVTEDGRVAILYNDFRFNDTLFTTQTNTDAWLAIYEEIDGENPCFEGSGLRFVKECRLSKESYIAENGPVTTSGVMTNGDYSGLVAADNKFYAAYTKTANGPFPPQITLKELPFSPIFGEVKLILDTGKRTSVFVSIVQ